MLIRFFYCARLGFFSGNRIMIGRLRFVPGKSCERKRTWCASYVLAEEDLCHAVVR